MRVAGCGVGEFESWRVLGFMSAKGSCRVAG